MLYKEPHRGERLIFSELEPETFSFYIHRIKKHSCVDAQRKCIQKYVQGEKGSEEVLLICKLLFEKCLPSKSVMVNKVLFKYQII